MERNYEIYDQELLGIIRALEEWHHYIQGSLHMTTIFSDHKNLTYFRTAQKLNRQQARWSLYLLEFNVSLIHLPGSKMIQSDTLSQQPDYGLDNEHNNEDIILLPNVTKSLSYLLSSYLHFSDFIHYFYLMTHFSASVKLC